MNSMIYKNKKPLLVFLIPAFAFLLVYLYYPFFQNVVNTFPEDRRPGARVSGVQHALV